MFVTNSNTDETKFSVSQYSHAIPMAIEDHPALKNKLYSDEITERY